MNPTKARINFNIDATLKEQTAKTLADLGMDMTTAINIYFKKIVNTHSIPFEISSQRYYSIEEVAGENWRDGLDEIEEEWE